LWHVRQAWLKCIKIKDGPICVAILKSLEEIMYNTYHLEDQEMNVWAKSELERVANNFLIPKVFWLYVKSKWLPKTGMWVVGYHNLPYA
jgi:hypothetical protein